MSEIKQIRHLNYSVWTPWHITSFHYRINYKIYSFYWYVHVYYDRPNYNMVENLSFETLEIILTCQKLSLFKHEFGKDYRDMINTRLRTLSMINFCLQRINAHVSLNVFWHLSAKQFWKIYLPSIVASFQNPNRLPSLRLYKHYQSSSFNFFLDGLDFYCLEAKN